WRASRMSPTSPAASALASARRRLSTPPAAGRRSRGSPAGGGGGVSKKRNSLGGPGPHLVQLNLDFGQSNLGTVTCSGCGMVYSAGNQADAVRHARFHASRRPAAAAATAAASAASASAWRGQQAVKEFFNGDRIVRVSPGAGGGVGWQRAKEIFRLMDEELGQGTEPDAYSGMLVLLYVRHQSGIVGCCIAEPIRTAYRLLPPVEGAEAATERDTEPLPAQCGIHKVWCQSGHRRSGVATTLLDAARSCLYLGLQVPLSLTAFTAPTPSGYRLACRYLATDRPLVY
ncbi:hypothetical protein BOX15_Mlig020499g4, partial [Macrostomum lignano]